MFLLLLVTLTTSIHSYNVDVLDPLPLSGSSPGEHFGFSAGLQSSGGSRWILVGAPRANVTLRDGSEGVGWGAVYNCSRLEGGYQCIKLVLDDTPPVEREVKQGQWTGVTLSVDPITSDAITCAHRYTKTGIIDIPTEIGMRGRCWLIRSNGKTVLLPEICNSAYTNRDQDSDRCSAGISAVYDTNEFVAVGGVGYQDWKGRSMFYDTKLDNIALKNKVFSGMFSKTYDYYGYATASCYDEEDKWTYVFSSAPRSRNIRGKVDYMKYYGSALNGVVSSQFAKGYMIGSYFGASITCGNTKPSTVQVIIGAPCHAERSIAGDYDRGKIYVYQVNKFSPGSPSFPSAQISGPNTGSRFGAVVSVIGDINKDGLDDLAVGAPSDQTPGAGRVYIYLGTKGGIKSTSQPVQVISPLRQSGGVPLLGFGSSISGGDVDRNGYPDVIVGSYRSDKAFVYRTTPIINIDIGQTFPNLVDNLVDKNDPCPNDTVTVACFKLHFCVKYLPDPYHQVDDSRLFSINVTNSLDVENDVYSKRVRFSEEKTYVVHQNLTDYVYGKEMELCGDQTIYLEEEINNIAQLISIKTEALVLPSPQFENRLSLNVSRYSYAISQIKIKTACANATCETDLRLTSSDVTFDRVAGGTKAGVLYPGFNELIWSNYSIKRNISLGKPFGAHLLITMPASMYVATVRGGDGTPLSICTPFSIKEGNYFCGLDNRLDTNETQFNFSVEYSVTGVKAQGTKEVIIGTELVTEGSVDVQPGNNVITHNITVRRLAELELRGTGSPHRALFQIRDKETKINFASDISTRGAVETNFFPINHGPGELNGLKLIMEVPFALTPANKDFIYPYKVDSNTKITCQQDFLNVHIIPSAKKSRLVRSPRRPRPSSPLGEIQHTLLNSPSLGSDPDIPEPLLFQCGLDVHCVNISCSIEKLTKDAVVIMLTSYVWELTFQEPVQVDTSIRAWVVNLDPGADLTANSVTGPVRIPLKVIAVEDLVRPVSIWIIIGSISGGLCFLALIVIILHKIGFFNRKRPPAEFYDKSTTNPGIAIEVRDDSHDQVIEPYISDGDEDEEAQFAFRNPLCDEMNM